MMEKKIKKILQEAVLYGIIDLSYIKEERIEEVLGEMIKGGVGIVQLRGKSIPSEEVQRVAQSVATQLATTSTLFIVNDYPEIARAVEADGVHLGQDDGSLIQAKKILDPHKYIIGRSTHSLDQALQAHEEGADYIGYGPLFATPTKPDYVPIGLEKIAQLHSLLPSLPIFCIGGIKLDNLEEVMKASAKRVVIVSGILHAQDVRGYCTQVGAKLRGTLLA